MSITTYRDRAIYVHISQVMMFRSAIKSAVEHGLVLSGAAAVGRRQRRGALLILAYHNIVPNGERMVGDQSLHLPQRAFARQLDALNETHDVISLADVIAQLRTPFMGDEQGGVHVEAHAAARPRAILTFDDAYCGTMTAGVEELRRRNLPATVFVTPAFLGGHAFWWDTLTPPDARSLSDHLREHALTAVAGKNTDILRWAQDTQIPTHEMPPFATCATKSQLTATLTYPRLTFGSHTWSHPNLTRLSAEELSHELTAPARWLEQFGNRTISAISYPYGRANETVWRAAETAGYDIGLMIEGGWATIAITSRYAIPRLNIPAGVSDAGFILRTSGLIAA